MTISKRLRQSALLLAALSFVFAFASCDLMGEKDRKEDIEIEGTWVDAYDYRLDISDDLVKFYTTDFSDENKWQECEIVSYDNDGFNADETGTGDCGYMVIKYTEPSAYATGAQDKYGILRWDNLGTVSGVTTVSYSEGYTGSYYDTAEEAEAAFTTAAGFAYGYTSATLQ